jgi:hypothetical protein
MSKRPTKKAAKKWKVGDKVRMTGEVLAHQGDEYYVQIDKDSRPRFWVLDTALRPAVELFEWSPKKAAKKKAGKK